MSSPQCFLSVPAWIYLCMAPRYSRTRKFANIYAMATVDGVFTVLWMSAWAAQAAYNTANLCGGACGESKAIVAMGFFVLCVFSRTRKTPIPQVRRRRAKAMLVGQVPNVSLDSGVKVLVDSMLNVLFLATVMEATRSVHCQARRSEYWLSSHTFRIFPNRITVACKPSSVLQNAR